MPFHSPAERSIRVELGTRGYDVRVGAGILDGLGATVIGTGAGRSGGRAFLVFDDGLPAATVQRATVSMTGAGLSVVSYPAHASEPDKSLATMERLVSEMTRHRLERTEPVIALGGGIIGDVAGFAAATYRRGVPVIQCPTTLLAMVDASVGGKTGVNLSLGGELKKNMVGAFHQPRAVLADVSVLESLPDRFFRAGLAECLKHGLIGAAFGDSGLFEWTLATAPAIVQRQSAALIELIARNVAVKANVVGADEREEDAAGGRALLNLGHTFGHAIETLPGLAPDGGMLQHGEAVGLGLIAAGHCAVAAGVCSADWAERITQAVAASGLPTTARGVPPSESVIRLMSDDKKVLDGRLRLILPTGPAGARVVENPPSSAIEAGLDAIRA